MSKDPLRVCPEGDCLFLARHKFCAWHGVELVPLLGRTIKDFRIERALSKKGGFGVVYYVRNALQEDLEAALKVLKPPHCYNEAVVEVFLREAGLGKRINCLQIPQIHDVSDTPWPHLRLSFI